MKFIHLSDLHIGKRVNEYSMIKDQQYILNQILDIINSESPDAVIIAGDVYDRSLPPTEAVTELDDFIFKLSEGSFETFIISGNHDSAERIAFGSRIMSKSGIHLSPVYNGVVKPFTLNDEFGEVDVYMLPFIKPFYVRGAFQDISDEIVTYTDAVKVAIEKMNVDTSKRNVIVSHQFVTGAERSDSEVISVGGTDNVDSYVYDPFDYVALGHIHSPQNIAGTKHIRYCGTPLKYSFSETKDKSVTVVELLEKGNLTVREIPLKPMRDMRTIRGTFDEIAEAAQNDPSKDDFIRAELTDKDDVDNAMSNLKYYYPNILEMKYLRDDISYQSAAAATADVESKSPLELIEEFFKNHGLSMTDEEKNFISDFIEEIEEEKNATD